MIASPAFLDALDEAINSSPWWLPNAPVFVAMNRRELLGQYGRPWNGAPTEHLGQPVAELIPATHTGFTYAWTRRQCKKMRSRLRQQAELIVDVQSKSLLP
jgi:hypothetical protein